MTAKKRTRWSLPLFAVPLNKPCWFCRKMSPPLTFVTLTPLRLHRAVDVFGAETGVVSGRRQFTYAQFGGRADGLVRLGIGAGDRVACLSSNNHQLLLLRVSNPTTVRQNGLVSRGHASHPPTHGGG